jgi:hypothetical protein
MLFCRTPKLPSQQLNTGRSIGASVRLAQRPIAFPSQKLLVTIFNYPDNQNPQSRSQKWLPISHGNTRLSLPYGRSRIYKFLRFPPTLDLQQPSHLLYTLFSILFPLYLLSLRGFEFSTSHMVLAAIPSFIKALEVRYLSNDLHISITI